MSMQRPLGPIGHCSAKLRRALAIDEEEALGRGVRIRKPDRDKAVARSVRGGRWARPANFTVPGAFHGRFVSSEGKSTFHFALQAVSKTSDGGCRITTPEGSKRLAFGASGDHDAYIDRPGAVEVEVEVEVAIAPSSFDGYASRQTATETIDGERAIFTNIAETGEERRRYWTAVHEHERTPGPDRLTLVPENASRASWRKLADSPGMPTLIRDIAASFALTKGKRKTRRIELDALALGSHHARQLVRKVADELGTPRGKHAVRLSEGRGGRSQYRLTAELPEGMDAAGRRAVVKSLCDDMNEAGFMYMAAIHAPDHHNDRRNYHLHVAFHDRPAKLIGNRWDFEISEPVKGQDNRVRYPHRQNKIDDFCRDPLGGGRRASGTDTLRQMRTHFADLCNAELDRLGVTRKLHPGNLESLGCGRTPQKPLGIRAAPLEAAGVPTVTGIDNAECLWTALLREAWTAAEDRAKVRAQLRRQLENAKQETVPGSVLQQALGNQAHSLIARLDASEAVLCQHDFECAEYDVTLAMARARPDKARDTCHRILAAIDTGEASAVDRRARLAIVARAREAEAFIAAIEAIDRDNTPILTSHRRAVATAQADADAVSTEATVLLERPEQARAVKSARTDSRATLEALFERIMSNDMPILLPDLPGSGYRVPGITRAELAAITAPTLAAMAQKRLSALADIQTKRMVAAADIVANFGLGGVERSAARGDPGATRTVKHAHAYADHPTYLRALVDAQAALSLTGRSAPKRRGGLSAGLRDRIASLMGRETPTPPTVPDLTGVLSEAAQPETAPPWTRDAAITALATALLTEPALRVVEGKHGLIIDTTDARDWARSAAAFVDEAAIRAAMLRRNRSPWLDVPVADRDRELSDLLAALKSADRRPVVKTEGQWHIDLAEERFRNIVTQWRGYDALTNVLSRADRHWHARETYTDGSTGIVRSQGISVNPGLRGDFERDRRAGQTVVAPVLPHVGLVRRGGLGR
jgi:hypothetical protein